MPIEDILITYENKSKDPYYANYSPLQCAIFDGALEDAQALMQHYKANKTLNDQLSFVANDTKENILQIAIKHPKVLEYCCQTIKGANPWLFTKLVEHKDIGQDNLFHQIVEFGRVESFKLLKPVLDTYVRPGKVQELWLQKNEHKETPADILHNYEGSKTIQQMQAKNYITPEDAKAASKCRTNLEAEFQEILPEPPKTGMSM
ncbi:hypothetical protein ACFORL_03375 [Legionella dresdenensis]|uniref:Ankyrin repeat protein n=1 Tax=Legionella dresdenensis TaxID=450200 RepID=A0ABV8CCS9_9GAMM